MQAEEQQQQLCHSLDIASHIDVLQKKEMLFAITPV